MIRQHRLIGLAFVFVALGIGGGPLPAIPPDTSHGETALLPANGFDDEARPATTPSDQSQRIAELRRIGGTVFERGGTVVEVNLDRTKAKDDDLDQLSGFTAMTDLSLEETAIGDDGLRRLSGLKNLVWLNLYRTRMGDGACYTSRGWTKLEHLPLGETRSGRMPDLFISLACSDLPILACGAIGSPTQDCGTSGS